MLNQNLERVNQHQHEMNSRLTSSTARLAAPPDTSTNSQRPHNKRFKQILSLIPICSWSEYGAANARMRLCARVCMGGVNVIKEHHRAASGQAEIRARTLSSIMDFTHARTRA